MLSRELPKRWQSKWVDAGLLYLLVLLVYALVAAPTIWHQHTPFNHFALQAEAWLNGRSALVGPPPSYAYGNDFALYDGRWYVVFPPVPALLLIPFLASVHSAESLCDGAVYLLLAPLAPVLAWRCFERLRALRLARLSDAQAYGLALLYAFGSVYFFSSLQGTVWFAAHVVAAVATWTFLLASLGASRPWLAGIALAAALGSRTPLGFAAIFFLFEALRKYRAGAGSVARRRLLVELASFATPVVVMVAALAYYNWVRFGVVTEFGYRYLSVAWKIRIETWGLFSYHYLGRNLAVVLAGLPFSPGGEPGAVWRINGHGLALWLTSPFYLALLWPRRRSVLQRSLQVTLLLVALPTLLYQNTGWFQFGQRFSNDYAPLLFLLLAVGGYRFGWVFRLVAGVALAVNLFGARSFQRPGFEQYYFVDPSQRILFQPD